MNSLKSSQTTRAKSFTNHWAPHSVGPLSLSLSALTTFSPHAVHLAILASLQGVHSSDDHRKLGPAKTCAKYAPLRTSSAGVVLGSVSDQIFYFNRGFGKGEYYNLFIDHNQIEHVLADRKVRAVKFTGSTEVGKIVAISAAKHVKKGTFEMSGNDAFVVLKDANIEAAVNAAVKSRMMNNGQACKAAKRFIITEAVYDKFKDMLIEKIKKTIVIGDPMDRNVNLGPLVSGQRLEKLQN